jgi:hypothetical protein
MTSSQVTEAIEKEIAGDWTRSNAHGVDLRRCLVVPPLCKKVADSFHEGQLIDMWLVLEENPDTKLGYKIVFDDKRGQFGLAIDDVREGSLVFIGYSGTFLATLEGM